MSADAWRQCPRCLKQHREETDAFETKVFDSYGSVPMEEFDRMRAQLNRMWNKQLDETLREDYSIVTKDTGEFVIDYTCSCTLCGWSQRFRHVEQWEVK